MDDSSDYIIVATLLPKDALDSAWSLLEMGGLAKNEVQESSAASSAVIAALAHLARTVEMGLVATAARRQGEEGIEPVRELIERRLPGGLFTRLRQLASDVHGPDFELDQSKPMVRLLRGAIRRRNVLVHEPGTYLIGNAKTLGVEMVDGRHRFRIATPISEWREVRLDYARTVVAAVEAYEEVMIMQSTEGTPRDDRFLTRVAERGGAQRRGYGARDPR